MPAPTRKIAVLIDGDNAESKLIKQILDDAEKHGAITIKRVYGDFSGSSISKNWSKELCNSYAILPVQKYAYTSGKNSTDTELIIGAMDILHSHLVEGFCIVSSDSDYTGLALRIREAGMFIMGVGRRNTPEAFVNACEEFFFTEVSAPEGTKKPAKKVVKKTVKKVAKKPEHIKTTAAKLPVGGQIKKPNPQVIDNAFNMAVNKDTGLALLGRFNQTLKQNDPTFDYRNFGFNTFRKFCDSLAPKYRVISVRNHPMSLKKLAPEETKKPEHIKTTAAKLPVGGQIKKPNPQVIDNAFNMAVNKDTGLALLGRFNQTLKQNDPTFDYHSFGFNSFRKFCEKLAPTYVISSDENNVMSLKKAE